MKTCMFCGELARGIAERMVDGKPIPVCRDCGKYCEHLAQQGKMYSNVKWFAGYTTAAKGASRDETGNQRS